MSKSQKQIAEETIGRASALVEAWQHAGRGPTNDEYTTFTALLDDAEANLGCGKIPRGGSSFLQWAKQPAPGSLNPGVLGGAALRAGGEFSNHAPGSLNGGGLKFYDDRGRCFRGLTNRESFADAIREQNAQYGGRDESEKWVADGLSLGGMLKAAVLGGGSSVEQAALHSGSGTSGGFTVPEYLSATLVDKLTARTVMLKAGALRVPLQGDTRFVKITGHPTADWRRERNTIAESEPTFGGIDFHPKSLAVVVKVSRELLQDSNNIAAAIERSLSEAFALELDRVGMFGTGVEEPMGLYNEPGLNEKTSVGTPDDYLDILDAYKLLLDDNAMEPTGLIMSNREWRTYAGLEDTTGQPLRRPPAIDDLPFHATSAVPTNLVGGAESVMFMGHFPEFIFGIRSEMQIDVLKELYAGTHEYGFVAHMRVDTGVLHAESFAKLTGVTG